MKQLKSVATLQLVTVVALFLASCSTITPGSDPVVVRAQQTIKQAKTSMDAYVHLEDSYTVQLRKISPNFHKLAESIRANGQQWITDGWAGVTTYQTTKDQSALTRALTILDQAIKDCQNYTSQAQSKGVATSG